MTGVVPSPDSPGEQSRPGRVRLTDAGETEVFDGVRWLPLASLYQDPADGDRDVPRERPELGSASDTDPAGSKGSQEPK